MFVGEDFNNQLENRFSFMCWLDEWNCELWCVQVQWDTNGQLTGGQDDSPH